MLLLHGRACVVIMANRSGQASSLPLQCNAIWCLLHGVYCNAIWCSLQRNMARVGQNHIYTVYIYVFIRYFWLGNHQIYGVYIRMYTVLANPKYGVPLC